MVAAISNVNGINEAFYAIRPAWHDLGTVIDHAATSEEAIRLAHLDWQVEKQDLRTTAGIDIYGQVATVRTDCKRVLGIVGDDYEVVQNIEAFNFLDGLLQDGIMKYESAGALRGGRQVWVLARMPSVDTIAEGDDCQRFALFSTSHDGSAAIRAIPTSVRVVCANTLRIATAGLSGIRHTQSARDKMVFAKQYLSQFDEKFTLFRDTARTLATRKYTATQAKDFIEKLFPTPKEAGRALTIRDGKVEAVRKALRSERQTLPSIKGTWWALVNAVTETIDHAERKSTPLTAEKKQARAERRFENVIEGPGADFKDRVFQLAVDMAS